jgi:hypothetical protein
MSSGEVVSLHTSHLPELAPVDAFSNPFYGNVAHRYWADESLISLQDAVTSVVAELTPAEVWQSRSVLDEIDEGRRSTVADYWINRHIGTPTASEADIAEEGVKTLTRIRTLLSGEYSNDIAQLIYRYEIDDAALKSNVGSYNDELQLRQMLKAERTRRERLAEIIESNRAQAAQAGFIPTRGLRIVK